MMNQEDQLFPLESVEVSSSTSLQSLQNEMSLMHCDIQEMDDFLDGLIRDGICDPKNSEGR